MMAVKKSLQEKIFGSLSPLEVRKYERYKNMMGIGEITAYAGAKGNKEALTLIKNRRIK